jgi:HK97 family phage major capsid protein
VNKTIRTLKARKDETLKRMQALNALLAEQTREPTAEETKAFETDKAAIVTINAAIEREELVERETKSLDVPNNARIEVDPPKLLEDPKRGFKHFGDFAASVKRDAKNGANASDERLRIVAAAPTTFGSEGAGADGGFAVPPAFSREIWTYAIREDSLIPFCDQTPVEGNSMIFPKDETVPWGTDGVRAYWQVEAGAGTQTKPALGTLTLRLHKLMALIPITDELLEDTNALNAYIPEKAGLSIRWKTNEAILFGNGNGQPLGCLNSNAALTVSKDAGQSTLTLSDTNIANMKARLPPGSKRSRLWLVNNDVLPALFTLKQSSGGGYPLYLPFGGGVAAIQNPPNANPDDEEDDFAALDGMLYNMPVYVSQHANTFSSLGDVSLYDLSYYRIITKDGGGIETATSMHLYFDADATAFRMLFRVDGQPKISKQISPAKGSNKLSPFLQLQAR